MRLCNTQPANIRGLVVEASESFFTNHHAIYMGTVRYLKDGSAYAPPGAIVIEVRDEKVTRREGEVATKLPFERSVTREERLREGKDVRPTLPERTPWGLLVRRPSVLSPKFTVFYRVLEACTGRTV